MSRHEGTALRLQRVERKQPQARIDRTLKLRAPFRQACPVVPCRQEHSSTRGGAPASRDEPAEGDAIIKAIMYQSARVRG